MADFPDSPLSSSGGMAEFPVSPMANGVSSLPFADMANQRAQVMRGKMQDLQSRVQKLERSRGQINKDIADMIFETREMMKKVGLDQRPEQKRGPLHSPGNTSEDLGTESTAEVDHSQLAAARRASRNKTAPAVAMPRIVEEDVQRSLLKKAATSDKIVPPPGLAMPLPESLTVTTKDIGGKQATRVEWRIDNVKSKFRDCVGRPLVSPPFDIVDLPDCRLMVSPNLGPRIQGSEPGGHSMREQKNGYEARIAEGPLSGTVKFKVVMNTGDKLEIKFNLIVGSVTKKDLFHDFSEHIIHGVEFNNNWLDELQGSALCVGVEVLDVDKH